MVQKLRKGKQAVSTPPGTREFKGSVGFVRVQCAMCHQKPVTLTSVREGAARSVPVRKWVKDARFRDKALVREVVAAVWSVNKRWWRCTVWWPRRWGQEASLSSWGKKVLFYWWHLHPYKLNIQIIFILFFQILYSRYRNCVHNLNQY